MHVISILELVGLIPRQIGPGSIQAGIYAYKDLPLAGSHVYEVSLVFKCVLLGLRFHGLEHD